MTNKEAIANLKKLKSFHKWSERYGTSMELAIEALEQEPKTEKVIKMRDATPEERESISNYVESISKLTGVNFWDLEHEPCEDTSVYGESLGYALAEEIVSEIPSVKPQQKIGRWILSGGYWKCSDCNQKALLKLDKVKGGCREYIPIRSNFCPNCGAKMVQKRSDEE